MRFEESNPSQMDKAGSLSSVNRHDEELSRWEAELLVLAAVVWLASRLAKGIVWRPAVLTVPGLLAEAKVLEVVDGLRTSVLEARIASVGDGNATVLLAARESVVLPRCPTCSADSRGTVKSCSAWDPTAKLLRAMTSSVELTRRSRL